MTVDIDKLRALLAEYHDALADYDRRSPLSKGVHDDVWAELSSAAVNALPELLAIAEAAMAYRDWDADPECPTRGIPLDRLIAAVDAARKAGT